MILIGSRALALRAPQLLLRKPLDFDFVCTQQEYDQWITTQSSKVNPTEIYPEPNGKKKIVKGSSIVEFEIIQPGESSELLRDLVENNAESLETPFGWIPSIDILFALKTSHRFLKNSPHFWKTVCDYHLMKRAGATIRPEHQDFLKLREKETYTYKHPSLNQSKDAFFKDDGIQYEFVHDTLHKAVMLNDKPAYEYYLKDGHEVQTDKKKFFACSEHIRLSGVCEEAMTLSLERSLIPHKGTWTPEYAFKFALMKVCSSITSGYFREYAYEHIFEVLKMYPTHCAGYYEKFLRGVESGLVRRV